MARFETRDMSRGMSKQYVKAKQDVEFYNQGEVQLGKANITRDIAIRP